MKKIKAIQILLLSFLSSCHSSSVQMQPVSSDATIVAFGDSLTIGYGLKIEDSYPSQLEKIINRKIINEGVSGETTEDGLNRFSQMLEQDNPQLILLCMGGNDMFHHFSNTKIKNNLEKMIDLAKEKNIQVFLIAVPTPDLFALKNNPVYEQVAKEEKIAWDNKGLVSVEGKNELKIDTVHLNAQGYQIIAQTLNQELHEAGAI